MEYTLKKGIYVMTIIFFLSLEFSHAQIHNNLNDGKFNTIMFKISSDKNDKISYLFGTHHAFGKAFFDSLPEANKALSASEVLLKENLNVPGQMARILSMAENNLLIGRNLLARMTWNFWKIYLLLVLRTITK